MGRTNKNTVSELVRECTHLFLLHKKILIQQDLKSLKRLSADCDKLVARLSSETDRRRHAIEEEDKKWRMRRQASHDIAEKVRQMASGLPPAQRRPLISGAAAARKRIAKLATSLLPRAGKRRKLSSIAKFIAALRTPIRQYSRLMQVTERKKHLRVSQDPEVATNILKNARVRCDQLSLKARLNLTLLESLQTSRSTVSFTARTRRALMAYASSLESIEQKTCSELKELLKSSLNDEELVKHCDEVAQAIDSTIEQASRQIGTYWTGVQIARKADEQIAAECEALLRCSEASRRLFIVRAYCVLISAKRDCDGFIDSERKAARNLERIASLVRSGHRNDQFISGHEIRATGIVSALKVSGRKTAAMETRFELISMDSHPRITVRAKHFSLLNNGLCNGAYCGVVGKLSLVNGENSMILDIDRISLKDMASNSWWDRITWVTRQYAKFYRDEMNLSFVPYPL